MDDTSEGCQQKSVIMHTSLRFYLMHSTAKPSQEDTQVLMTTLTIQTKHLSQRKTLPIVLCFLSFTVWV